VEGEYYLTCLTGTGKTFLSEAIGLECCKMGYPAQKIRYKRLFEEIQAVRDTGEYLKYLSKLQKIKVLILDDFLMDPIDEEGLSDLMEIIEDRSQRMPLIITTQYSISKWHAQIPNPTTADAICDRLKNGTIHLRLGGPSLRKEKK
jgi:DNA replication protein DnaC